MKPWQFLFGALLCSVMMGWRLWFASESSLIGWRGGEVYGHAWVQWWHGLALPKWPEGTDLALGASSWPVIDPLTTFITGGLGRLFGWSLSWNFLLLGGIFLAFIGGAFAAHKNEGSPWIGGVILATAPVFNGSLASGLTEDAGLGLVAIALTLIANANRVLLGGVLLGFSAWCGLVLAWLGGLAAVILGVVEITQNRRTYRVYMGGGALCVLFALPAAFLQGSRILGEGHRHGVLGVREYEAMWQVNPWHGADLASFFVPLFSEIPGDAMIRLHPVYLGWVALLLAFGGGKSRWWWVLGLATLMAPGRALRWMGSPLGIENPTYFVQPQLIRMICS